MTERDAVVGTLADTVDNLRAENQRLQALCRGAHDMLREAAKQFRLRGDNGHAAMCDLHADALREAQL